MSAEALILTWHSVSDAPGPTSIPASTFAMQMETLAAEGYGSASVEDVIAWHEGRAEWGRKVLLSFDDAFADFAETAVPIMRRHGFGAVMFVPTRLVEGDAAFDGKAQMRPADVRRLADGGFEFGGHGRHHVRLTQAGVDQREDEIRGSGEDLAGWLGRRTVAFAAPYGDVNGAVVAEIARHYGVAFGTRFAPASREDDRFDLPRIDMHYFRNRHAWRDFLRGGRLYLRARQALRSVGQAVRS